MYVGTVCSYFSYTISIVISDCVGKLNTFFDYESTAAKTEACFGLNQNFSGTFKIILFIYNNYI